MITLYDHIQELRAELRGCYFARRERAAVQAQLTKAIAEQAELDHAFDTTLETLFDPTETSGPPHERPPPPPPPLSVLLERASGRKAPAMTHDASSLPSPTLMKTPSGPPVADRASRRRTGALWPSPRWRYRVQRSPAHMGHARQGARQAPQHGPLARCGSPRGAERIAAGWAENRKVPQFKPDWSRHCNAAPLHAQRPHDRGFADRLVVFLGSGISANLADKAKKLGIPL